MTPTELRTHRARLALTRPEFGELLGVSASDVLRWERGRRPLPDPFVLALACAYVELCVDASRRRRESPAAVQPPEEERMSAG